MYRSDEYFLNILLENGGYGDAHKWINFARKHDFKKIKSKKLSMCPSCKNERLSTFSQYIYYSNIFHIKYCPNCGLYFSDTLLDDEIVSQHFENAYKDENYFNDLRRYIFQYIVQLADENTPLNGKVLDIGGGKGHLLNMFSKARPDAIVKLNDISKQSCDYCSKAFGIESICCGIPDLINIKEKFSTILLIDVIYYEPLINEMFHTIDNMLNSEQGTLIIRIPNKLTLIKISQLMLKLFGSNDKKYYQNSVKYYNPEHIYIFSKSYLSTKLRELGFNNISFISSPWLCKSHKKGDARMKLLTNTTSVLNKLRFNGPILTPSMILIAKKS